MAILLDIIKDSYEKHGNDSIQELKGSPHLQVQQEVKCKRNPYFNSIAVMSTNTISNMLTQYNMVA